MKTSHGKNRRRLLQGPRKGIALILALVLIVILSVAASAAQTPGISPM